MFLTFLPKPTVIQGLEPPSLTPVSLLADVDLQVRTVNNVLKPK